MGYERAVVKATAVGVLAAAAARFLGPAAAGLAADGIPRARDAAAAWLTPPYLYLVINAIIISIAASSRFQPSSSSDRPSASAHMDPEPADVAAVEPPPAPMQVAAPVPAVAVVRAEEFGVAEEPVVTGNTATPAPAQVPEKEEDEEEFSISRSSWTPRRRGADPVAVAADKEPVQDDETAPFADLTNNSREKPLVSSRFSRKAAKASPEGSRALRRVARPRKEETLESTWKAITEGRAPPLARHLKKSDTWDTRPGRRPSGGSGEVVDPAAGVAAAPPAMRKAETFNDGRSSKAPAPVRREPSLGQDELNRRVEAFINKFNMEMRLQRQESLKQYNEMLRHGRDGVY